MSDSENSRWLAVGALGAAMFAIGFSFAGVACNTHDVSVAEATPAASPSALSALAASLGEVARVVNAAPSASSAPAISASTNAPVSSPAPSSEAQASTGLKLKRIVVARKIENREPVAGDRFRIGSAPVYAFVEFENSARDARDIRVLFQNEDTKATVGHVKLTVPPLKRASAPGATRA